MSLHFRLRAQTAVVFVAAMAAPCMAQAPQASTTSVQVEATDASRALANELTRTSKCSGTTVFSDLRQRLAKGDVAAPDASRALATVVNDITACPALRTAAAALQETTYPAPVAATASPSPTLAALAVTNGAPAADPAVAAVPPPAAGLELSSTPSDFVVGPPPRNLTRERSS